MQPEPTRTLDEIAGDLGFPVEAVVLVAEVGDVMTGHAYNAGMSEIPHLGAEGFCRLLRSLAHEEFGPSAPAVLERWGLYQSEDIGRIVFALVKAGWLEASADDSLADFDGLFVSREFFA